MPGEGSPHGDAASTPGDAERRSGMQRLLERDEAVVEASRRADGEDALPTRAGTETGTPTDSPTETPTDSPTETATPRTLTRERHLLLEGTRHETPFHVIDAPRDGPTGFVVGGMHGDERSGFRAAESLVGWHVEYGRLVVLPGANRIALDRESRYGRHGDLNRKFPPTADRDPGTELARAIWETVVSYDPGWLADLHSSYGIYLSGDGGVGQAIFPSTVGPAARYATHAVRTVNREFDLSGNLAYERGGLLDGDRPMLAHRASELLDIPTFILETTEKIDLDRQVALHRTSMVDLLRSFDHGPRR